MASVGVWQAASTTGTGAARCFMCSVSFHPQGCSLIYRWGNQGFLGLWTLSRAPVGWVRSARLPPPCSLEQSILETLPWLSFVPSWALWSSDAFLGRAVSEGPLPGPVHCVVGVIVIPAGLLITCLV